MAKLAGYLGDSLYPIGRSLVLSLAGSNGVLSTTISADATFDKTSAMVSLINGGAANRNVSALAPCEVAGMWKIFKNTGSTNNLVLKDSGGNAITGGTLTPGDWGMVFYNGTAWTALTTSPLATILATANTWTAAQAFSAAITSTSTITTTGGVSGGTAQRVGGFVHIKQSTTTVTNTTTPTDLATHTLEASYIGLGTEVEITGTARITGTTGTPTLNLKLYCGTTVIDQTTALTVTSGDYYNFSFRLTGQAAASASSNVAVNGVVHSKINGTKGTNVSSVSPASMATNGTLQIHLEATWNAASTSNIVACDDFAIRVTR